MTFLSPFTALIAAGIAIPALVLLYFLKLRRRQVAIPSTLLWKKAVQDMQVNSPFQKLRRNLLLLLQLLILIALLIAMARPTSHTTAAPGARVIVVIDHSASMNATDISPTRLDEAKRAALDLVNNMDVGSEMMVVSFAHSVRVDQQFTSDRSLLRSKIRDIQPTDQLSNIAPAIELVENWASKSTGEDGENMAVYILTDGQVHQPSDRQLKMENVEEPKFITISSEDADEIRNVGIVSFAARRDFEKPHIVQVFARVIHRGPEEVRPTLTLKLDGAVTQVQQVTLPPATGDEASSRAVQFDFVLPGAALLELSHDIDDVLEADNTARMTLAPSRRLRVLMVTRGNAFLQRVIESIGVRNLVQMFPEKYEDQTPEQLQRAGWDETAAAGEEGYDVIIFDGYAPKMLPTVNSLYLGALPPLEGVDMREPRKEDEPAQPILDWQRTHPLLRYVVLDDVVLSRPDRLVLPDDAQVLATAQSGPVMATIAREGTIHAFTSFNVLNSNWPLYVSFPVFFSNALQQLGLGSLADQAGLHFHTGQVLELPKGEAAGEITWTGPDALTSIPIGNRSVLPAFPRAGVYQTDADIEEPFDRLSVNLLDPIESDLKPVDKVQIGTVAVQGERRTVAIRREIWPWFVWAALAVLMVEWLLYTRRMHI